jgi:hypothetical protein
MPLYDNEKPRSDSTKIVRPFNVLSVDAGCGDSTEAILQRLRKEYPKLLRDTDLLVGDLQVLGFSISESLSIEAPKIPDLLTDRFKDLQFGDLSKRVVIINSRAESDLLFSTFRNPETALSTVVEETTELFAENNPSMVGLSYAIDPSFGKAFLEEVRILSIGLTAYDSADLIQYQCKQLLDKHFHRARSLDEQDLFVTVQWLKEFWK